jgi:hypothetical protein
MRLALTCVLTSILTILNTVAASAQSSGAVAAARSAASVGVEWLGPHRQPNPALDVREPVWQGRGAMLVEQEVAQRVIRSWWPAQIADAKADQMLDGFAAYLQTLAIERVFDARYLRLAHSVESRRYLGNHVIWSFPPLRLSRHAAVRGHPPSPEAPARPSRYALVFAGLERWLGAPALQGAMFQVAQLPDDRLSAETIVKTMSDAAGQDLSWAFEAAATGDVNYAVAGLFSADASGCAAPCVETTVNVTREGDGVFAGRSGSRTSDFESGDALSLTVSFADGTQSSVRWDGRDAFRTFRFRGPSPATAAHLDPDQLVTLDRNRLDNAIVTASPTNVPVRKWVARWMVWLQHTMLSYGSLT